MAVFVILNTRDKKIWKVCSYLVLGLCFLCNLIFAIVYGTNSPANDGMSVGDLIKEQEAGAPYFNFAAMLFPFLTFVICIPFHIVDAVKDKFSQDFASAVYLIMPLLCFGLQFLMFFYWYVALIVMAVLFVLSFVVGIFWDPFKNAGGGGGGGARGLQPGDVTTDRVERALRYSELEHWIESLSVTNGYTYGHVNVDLYVRESMGGGQGKYSASHIERILKSEIGSDVMKYVTINLYTTRR